MTDETPQRTKVEVVLLELNDNTNLTEIERIKSNPAKYKILVEETVMIPFRHIEYEVINQRSH